MTQPRSRFSPAHIALLVAAVAGVAYGVWQWQRAHAARLALDQATAEQTRLRAEVAKISARIEAAAARASAAEKDNQLLTAALEKARQAAPKPPTRPSTKPMIARSDAEQRIRQARDLGRNGDPEHALRELLWCWDEGLRALPGPTATGMRSMITTALGQLAQRYPQAKEELNARLETLQRQLRAGEDGDDAVVKFSSLARALERSEAVVELYDQLEAKSLLRRNVGIYAFAEFVTRQRYEDAAAGRRFETMQMQVEQIKTQSDRLKEHSIKSVATNIEVLAGAGKLEEARTLATRLLQLDNAPETRELVQQHLTRAGKPDLLGK